MNNVKSGEHGGTARISTVLFAATSLLFLYTAAFGSFSATPQRVIHWTALTAGLFLFSLESRSRHGQTVARSIDTIFLLSVLAAGVYAIVSWRNRAMIATAVHPADVVFGTVAILAVLESTRRATGPFLMLTTLFFLIYAFVGPWLPGFLGHRGETYTRVTYFLFTTTEGIFGIPMGISATFIIVFVIFGAFLSHCGGGQFFIDIANAATGRFRGGPAKTAVVASGLMGMISGSPVANVATTGAFTIPLMKQVGFPAHIAGAVEAAASTGGMFTPPIMGSAAFIMAQYLEVPYASVARAAIVPAILYYGALMLSIDALSVRGGLKGLSADSLPKLGATIKERGLLFLPLLVLVVLILYGWSPMRTAFVSIVLTILAAFIHRATRPGIKDLLQALVSGSRNVMPIAVACAAAGIIVGVIAMTGLGVRMSSALIRVSGGNVWVSLLMTMAAAIILGCGMPPPAVYIILSSIIAPPLVRMGVAPISAHMFIFMFATVGAITPPVALAAYTAAGIAESDPGKTGWHAFILGLPAFLIPFSFALAPQLLLQGSGSEIMMSVVTAAIGTVALVVAIQGYLVVRWPVLFRLTMGCASILLLNAGGRTDVLGLALIGACVISIVVMSRSRKRVS